MSSAAEKSSAASTEGGVEKSELDQLIEVLATLRAPNGCPWDREQSHESLVRYLIEESYELVDAIESGDRAELLEELGDVLYQVLFHADIASKSAAEGFDIHDVAKNTRLKMIGRHPHIFAEVEADTSEDVMANWEALKRQEKPERSSVLDGIPLSMPALLLAEKLLGKAKDFAELQAEQRRKDQVRLEAIDPKNFSTEAELGELLFSIVSEAKQQGLDSERALRNSLRKFSEQITKVETSD